MNRSKFRQARRLIKFIKETGNSYNESSGILRTYYVMKFPMGEEVPLTSIQVKNVGTYIDCKCTHCSMHMRNPREYTPPVSPYLCMIKNALIMKLSDVTG